MLTGCSLSEAACDRGDQHDFIAVLEGIGLTAKKADVLVVHIDIDESTQLAGFVLDLRGKRREGGVDVGYQGREICGVRRELLLAVGVTDEGSRQDDFNGQGGLLAGLGKKLIVTSESRGVAPRLAGC